MRKPSAPKERGPNTRKNAPDREPKPFVPPARAPQEAPSASEAVSRGLEADLKKLDALRAEKYQRESEAKELGAAAEELMIKICRDLDQMNLSSVRVNGLGTCSRTTQFYPSIVQGHEDEVFGTLTKLGYGSLIKRTVHSQSLRSVIGELKSQNQPVPKGIEVYEKPYIRVTRPKK